jgi:hypothetical protein
MKPPTPAERLTRMAKSFDKNRSVLLDEYNHVFTPRESTPPSTGSAFGKQPDRHGRVFSSGRRSSLHNPCPEAS